MSFDGYRLSYDEQINRVIAFGGQEHDFYLKVKADVLVELLRRELSAQCPDILDIGCGNGTMHPFLLSSGLPLRLTGVEVAPQFLALAKEANPQVNYDVYDGVRLPYEDARYDAAVAICVMHHVPPPQWPLFIDEMVRVVKPGGLVIVFEHNPHNPLTLHIVKTCPIDSDAVLLRPRLLGELMNGAGLVAMGREFVLFNPFKGAAFRRLDRAMRWLPLGAQYVSFGHVPSS
jgi:SAM-dependent methyltransferase